ncbi:FkbM family methyltransferase [Candidatus Reidiella endopervernicosa]|uniref:FkbM family methyltransferase n=1 Tax=Candidatus Reidiella endopervernicosa TaxID=2738883 RepID=UPI001F20D5C7|nr:FkbM family methyltransferase [Candidatus Reidiella endopervernicosa]
MKLASRYLAARNMIAVRRTPLNEVTALIEHLAPVSFGKELIRLGPDRDGGYLVPDVLDGIATCYSPGVGSVSGFESDCADRGMDVYMADASVEKPAVSNDLFHFSDKFIGAASNEAHMTLDEWVDLTRPDSEGDLILQIDVEGAEYEVFLSVSERLLKRFRIIVVEFHGLDQLFNLPFFELGSRVFDKILQTHTCVHNHPNNYSGSTRLDDIVIPKTTELTFLRNDYVKEAAPVTDFPHQLDCDNSTKHPLHLPKCWYLFSQ